MMYRVFVILVLVGVAMAKTPANCLKNGKLEMSCCNKLNKLSKIHVDECGAQKFLKIIIQAVISMAMFMLTVSAHHHGHGRSFMPRKSPEDICNSTGLINLFANNNSAFCEDMVKEINKVVIVNCIIIGLLVLYLEIVRGVQAATKNEEEPVTEMPGYYSYPHQIPEYYSSPQQIEQYSSYTSYQSRAANDNVLTQVLNSIDPVDLSFRFMNTDEACRKRALCEISALPYVIKVVRYLRSHLNILDEYQDALSAGEALEDCALLFSNCQNKMQYARKLK